MNKLIATLVAVLAAAFLISKHNQGQEALPTSFPPEVSTKSLEVIEVEPDGAITARVVRVLDGDTIAVMIEGKEKIIRLTGVDCPEMRGDGGQPFGKAAKKFTSDLCFNRDVQIVQTGKHFDRWLAFVYVDGEFLQHELLRAGLAWHAVKYSSDQDMQAMHDAAKAAHVGLWRDVTPIDPTDWRQGDR